MLTLQQWGNWQYNAGVGNDPREGMSSIAREPSSKSLTAPSPGGAGRIFNPIKQAYDYDPHAEYIKAWVNEVHNVETPAEAFQYGENPLKRIEYKGNMQQRRKGGGGGGGKYGGSSKNRGGRKE